MKLIEAMGSSDSLRETLKCDTILKLFFFFLNTRSRNSTDRIIWPSSWDILNSTPGTDHSGDSLILKYAPRVSFIFAISHRAIRCSRQMNRTLNPIGTHVSTYERRANVNRRRMKSALRRAALSINSFRLYENYLQKWW